MNPAYALADVASIYSPSLVLYPELIRRNIARVIEMAGGAARLRPHVKTHKTREIARMMLDAGITKHKCATIAEAEMLASAGAPDVLIAYPIVGPNLGRLATLMQKFPETTFSVLIDHPESAAALSAAMAAANLTIGVILDLDVGQHRTGIAVGNEALALYLQAARMPGLRAEGFQLYDGHNHQESPAEREAAVRAFLAPALALRREAESKGAPVPRLICGGTPTFPIFSKLADIAGIECSPGTFVLHDAGYGARFADLAGITPAAVLITRVISRPTANRVTLDLGNKAVAADPLLEKRVKLLDFPDYRAVGHNEEHLIVETAGAAKYRPGDVVYALPGHVCPTVALHKEVLISEGGQIVGKWTVAARDRVLTI
ncbi:MAG TPA: D-TA family PLP-dependent enzyme [Urbifossiella sp.]|nr:D-TA family PLP-dependent enzyme [Urbifossiella sp.]